MPLTSHPFSLCIEPVPLDSLDVPNAGQIEAASMALNDKQVGPVQDANTASSRLGDSRVSIFTPSFSLSMKLIWQSSNFLVTPERYIAFYKKDFSLVPCHNQRDPA